MDGIDYGGVEVKVLTLEDPNGWDVIWFTGSYDTYDTTFEDEKFELDGSTVPLTLSQH